jgi:3-hydroxybutyrate dehydrogenase
MRDPMERRSVPESPEGRVALVTGGGTGVGANIARGLADAGMDVWVTGRTKDRIEAMAAEIGGHALAGDVSQGDDVARWFEQAGPLICSSTTRACKARW